MDVGLDYNITTISGRKGTVIHEYKDNYNRFVVEFPDQIKDVHIRDIELSEPPTEGKQ